MVAPGPGTVNEVEPRHAGPLLLVAREWSFSVPSVASRERRGARRGTGPPPPLSPMDEGRGEARGPLRPLASVVLVWARGSSPLRRPLDLDPSPTRARRRPGGGGGLVPRLAPRPSGKGGRASSLASLSTPPRGPGGRDTWATCQ